MFTRTVAATVTVVALLAASCSSAEADLTGLAKDTCAELEGFTVAGYSDILSEAISDADDLGFGPGELGAKMREECPGLMAAVKDSSTEPETRYAIPAWMRVTTARCTKDGSNGQVKNNSEFTVDIWIRVQYLDADGVILSDGLDSIDGIRPGETANWSHMKLPSSTGRTTTCRTEVTSVFES